MVGGATRRWNLGGSVGLERGGTDPVPQTLALQGPCPLNDLTRPIPTSPSRVQRHGPAGGTDLVLPGEPETHPMRRATDLGSERSVCLSVFLRPVPNPLILQSQDQWHDINATRHIVNATCPVPRQTHRRPRTPIPSTCRMATPTDQAVVRPSVHSLNPRSILSIERFRR